MYRWLLVQGLKSGSFEVGGLASCEEGYFSIGEIVGEDGGGWLLMRIGQEQQKQGVEQLLLLVMVWTRRRFALMGDSTGSCFHEYK